MKSVFSFCGLLVIAGASAGGSPEKVTYHRDIAPILHRHCAECHREGEVAPFPLLGYEDAAKRADWMAEMVETRRMPPWKAEVGHGEFLGERRLSEEEIGIIQAWAKAGAPEGDVADAPPVPTFAEGWKLGEPDVVLECPHEVTVAADGPDTFHHFVLPVELAAGREVAAVEFRPGNARVVHHAVILLDPSGLARVKDESTPEPGYLTDGGPGTSLAGILTIWAPGVTARRLPEDVAIKMPERGDILVQLHLHPSGKEEKDRSRVGIYFAKKPAARHIMNRPFLFGPVTIDIAPGEKNYETGSTVKLPVDLWLTAVLPHMHYLGKEMKVSAKLPDGSEKSLIWIRDWDFNWQDQYVYREPVHLPAGTEVSVKARYDNSAENPHNPRTPPTRVLFGEETNEEMCLAIFQAIAAKPEDAQRIRDMVAKDVFRQLRQPGVSPELVNVLRGHLQELARSELQAAVRSQLISALRKPSENN